MKCIRLVTMIIVPALVVFVILGKALRYKPSSATVPNYVLNFNQQIKPPLQCIPFLTIRGPIPICVHDNPNEHITRHIRQSGIWEGKHTKSLQEILVANPDYGVVDIGANLGMFSLLAANLKKPALAIEALDININKFHQSIVINRFEKYITLVTSPVSDKYEILQLDGNVANLGQSRLVKSSNQIFFGKVPAYHEKKKTTVLLDDLIDLMPRKKAVMLIDVEGNEGSVIRGGQKFFDAIHISHVFMEWINLLPNRDKGFLVDFFSGRGYEPYNSPSFDIRLNCSEFTRWPTDVFWRKKTYVS